MARETLVLLPGMMCDARLFGPQVEAFGARYDIVIPELVQPTIAGMAEAVLAGVSAGRFNLAGLSMGGIVAMAMAAIAPERIARLALLDTNHLADAPERFAIRNRQIADVEAGKLRAVIVDEMKPVYLASRNRDDQALLDLLIAMAMDCGAQAFIAQSQALRDRPDQTAALSGFRGPSLVLCGEEDRLCPVERHREMAALLVASRLVIVPGAGHISTLENAPAVNAALAQWLARPAGGNG